MSFQLSIRLPLRAAVWAAVCLAYPLVAQPDADWPVLERKIATAAPAEKSAALLALSQALESQDMTRAIAVARQARQLATRPHDESIAEARLATLLRRRGDYPEALEIARAGLLRAEEQHDDPARADLLLVFAQINGSVADYPSATEAYQKLLSLGETLGNRYYVARGHLGLSVIYGDTNETAKARVEEELVVQIAKEIGNRELEADGLNNLGNNYRFAGEFGPAREAHERALALRTAAGDRRRIGDSLVNLGEVARGAGDYPAALDYTQRAFAIYQQLGLKRYQANAHVQLAAILRASGRLDEALDHLQTGLDLAHALNSQLLYADLHREFSLVYEAKGDSAAALEALRQSRAATEAALGEKSRLQIAFLNARYNVDHREQELARLRAADALRASELRATTSELARARSEKFLLFASLLVTATLGAAATLLWRHRPRLAPRE